MEETPADKPRLKHYGIGHIKRLKDRFIQDKVSKCEIIELLLSYVIKGMDVKPQAKEIFKLSRGNFKNVFEILSGNKKVKGIGRETEIFFKVIKKFFECMEEEKFINKKYSVKAQGDVIKYFKNICLSSDKEEVHAVFLDAKNKITGHKRISEGTLSQSLLYPREIIKEAISQAALSIIILHNHPSGDSSPSENDKKITKRMLFAAREMDIMLLDHIIIGMETADGDKGYYSFYEEGLIDKYRENYRYVMEKE
jgi:DNA repair protein RadC